MAILQTVTYVNGNSAVSYIDEWDSFDAIYDIAYDGDVAHVETFNQAIQMGNMFEERSFNANTQTLTFERTWLKAAWDAYRQDYPGDDSQVLKGVMEAHGWVLSETVAEI